MHQQSTLTERISVEDVSVLVGAYMHADDEYLSVLDVAVAVLEVDASCADAFDLGAEKLDARFIFFFHEIIVVCFFILRGDLYAAVFSCQSLRLPSKNFAPNGAKDIIHYFLSFVKREKVE